MMSSRITSICLQNHRRVCEQRIASDLLDAFCDFKLRKESSDVTDGMLLAEIAHLVDNVKKNRLPGIKELFKRGLKLNMGESDIEARVLDYIKTFNRIVADNGFKECFQDADGRLEKCKRLIIASLYPKTIKSEVKQCVRFTHQAAASDARQLFSLVVGILTEHERRREEGHEDQVQAARRAHSLIGAHRNPQRCTTLSLAAPTGKDFKLLTQVWKLCH
ncbi:unnamed protein product [Phytophthora fragariaefolia]|uniref:Unnamed protein product n=1 Tax=Phytophthora fragariaefolia TaxID=1490495 RepID=A0A9W7DAB7_9STRA|nr:unnamed protein product [Phytophthora fragariaefolia]